MQGLLLSSMHILCVFKSRKFGGDIKKISRLDDRPRTNRANQHVSALVSVCRTSSGLACGP